MMVQQAPPRIIAALADRPWYPRFPYRDREAHPSGRFNVVAKRDDGEEVLICQMEHAKMTGAAAKRSEQHAHLIAGIPTMLMALVGIAELMADERPDIAKIARGAIPRAIRERLP